MTDLMAILSSPAVLIALGVIGAVILVWAAARIRNGALEKRLNEMQQQLSGQFQGVRSEAGDVAQRSREELGANLRGMSDSVARVMGEMGRTQQSQLDTFAGQLRELSRDEEARMAELRRTVETRLSAYEERIGAIGDVVDNRLLSGERRIDRLREGVESRLTSLQTDNGQRLTQMQQMVDEKLTSTLDKRVSESFRLVSDRLEQVYNGLGEIEALASGVGDLRRVLTGVKSRGAVGEIQLGALLSQILSPDQYEAEVLLREGAEPVSFAIRLPGRSGGAVSYLPIDARFPHEAYDRLIDAVEQGDAQAAEAAGAELEKKLLRAAERIHTQYITPPATTDFAVLFLGSEGLYAEALRRPGLAERMQREHHVTLTGPSTLAALVNALQMGFKTLALEKRAEEVWALLGAVRGEFATFAEALGRTQKRIRQASESIEDAAEKSRLIEKRLRGVEKLGTKQRKSILGKDEEEDSELFNTDWD
jgi:DNA recombination protein RmuC